MKILQVNTVFGFASTGTIVRDVQALCEQQGIECHVAYSVTNLEPSQIKNGYQIGNNLEHKMHGLLCRINGEQAYFSYFSTLRFICHINKIKPDIVHLHTIHGNYLNIKLIFRYLAKKNIRTIITLHDCWYYTGGCFHYTQVGCFKWRQSCGNCPKKRTDTPAYFLDKSSAILSDRRKLFDAIQNLTVVGVSKWIAKESKKGVFYDKNVTTIYNGVDTNIFKPTPSDFRQCLSLEGKFVIMGLVGKWFDPLNKDAFDYIVSKLQSDDRLLLFGCKGKRTDLSPNIIQFGYTTNREELAALYSCADVFINSTHEESFSLINIEPQACGTPVVTYANTGAQETVDNSCSFSVQTDDYKAMWEKVQLIKATGKAIYTEQCIKRVNTLFGMENNYKQYIDLYRKNNDKETN